MEINRARVEKEVIRIHAVRRSPEWDVEEDVTGEHSTIYNNTFAFNRINARQAEARARER